jgi:hypothetical protein
MQQPLKSQLGIGALAKVMDLLLSACQEPEQGNGLGSRGAGNSRPGELNVTRLSGPPELFVNLAKSAADPEGSVGGVEKKPWSFWQALQSGKAQCLQQV